MARMEDFDIGNLVKIDGDKLKVIDFASHIHVYQDFPNLNETTVQEWFLKDEANNLFKLEIPLNRDEKLIKFFKINKSGKESKQINFSSVEKV